MAPVHFIPVFITNEQTIFLNTAFSKIGKERNTGMFLRLTDHFRGKLPVDAGGLVFGGRMPKEVDDAFGERIAAMNFPYVAKCDRDGNFLVDVPPVKVAVFVDAAVKEEPKVSLHAAAARTASTDDGAVQSEELVQPVIEAVDEKQALKKRK